MVIVVVFCLMIAHPGPVFARAEYDGGINALGEPKVKFDSEPAFTQETVIPVHYRR